MVFSFFSLLNAGNGNYGSVRFQIFDHHGALSDFYIQAKNRAKFLSCSFVFLRNLTPFFFLRKSMRLRVRILFRRILLQIHSNDCEKY